MIIYLDESGDLGFDFVNKSPSQKFVITLLVCETHECSKLIGNAIKRTLRNKLNRKGKSKRIKPELKGADTSITIKRHFIRQLPTEGWKIYAVAVNKRKVFEYLKNSDGKKKLYNFISRFLLEKVDLRNSAPAVTVVVDRSKNKDEIEDFNQYVTNQLESLLPLNVPLTIYHEHSYANTGLQAADMFCWGMFRKYEHRDNEWYKEFSYAVVFETEYLREET